MCVSERVLVVAVYPLRPPDISRQEERTRGEEEEKCRTCAEIYWFCDSAFVVAVLVSDAVVVVAAIVVAVVVVVAAVGFIN